MDLTMGRWIWEKDFFLKLLSKDIWEVIISSTLSDWFSDKRPISTAFEYEYSEVLVVCSVRVFAVAWPIYRLKSVLRDVCEPKDDQDLVQLLALPSTDGDNVSSHVCLRILVISIPMEGHTHHCAPCPPSQKRVLVSWQRSLFLTLSNGYISIFGRFLVAFETWISLPFVLL